MSLRDRIQTDVTAAMRSGDSLRRDVLRMAQNAVYAVEKRERREPTDDDVAAILTREVKTRRESIVAFRNGGREDLAGKEEAEIAILTDYLPEQLDDVAIQLLVAEAVAATGAANVRDLGKVMGWLSPKTRGRADGKRVSELVAQALARADLAGHDAAPADSDGRPAVHDSGRPHGAG
ncbi:MAG TPA: GatB/YqeY domain-containing protein [Patescibacteria group bacterium]|nr:GatB/YqeY domain-containing protein [Patescibacteria group bacterium]